MQVLDALVIGCRGAENGFAQLFVRGTGSRATWYSDFEGTVPVSSGADISLDGNGAAVVYVNQEVDVRLLDSSGVLLRSFAAADGAPRVEVISPSFTGRDYLSGATGTNKPTNLQTVLDAWLTSAGGPDWYVKADPSLAPVPLSSAFAASIGYLRSVKDVRYGATGDGATDDSVAIQACLDAGPGIVLFPYGTYRTTVQLNVPQQVQLLGVGLNISVIRLDSATASAIAFAAGGDQRKLQTVSGITFTNAQATTGGFVRSNNTFNQQVLFRNCGFVSDAFTVGWHAGGLSAPASESFFRFENCYFNSGASKVLLAEQGSWEFEYCFFYTGQPSPPDQIIDGVSGSAVPAVWIGSCKFDYLEVNKTSHTVAQMGNTGITTIGRHGFCHNVIRHGGGGSYGTDAALFIWSNGAIMTDNQFNNNVQLVNNAPGIGTANVAFCREHVFDLERVEQKLALSASGAFTLHSGLTVVDYTFAGNITITIFEWHQNLKYRVIIYNNSGANRAISFSFTDGAMAAGTNASSVVNGAGTLLEFEGIFVNNKKSWLVTERTSMLIP